MIFGRDLVTCDGFGNCHDEIIVASCDLIGRWPIYGHYLQGEGCFCALAMRTITSGHRSHHRWSRRENQVLDIMNLHPILCRTMQLSIFFHQFRCILDRFWNVGSDGMSSVLGLIVGSSIGTTLWLRRSTRLCSSRASTTSKNKVTREKHDGRIWIDYHILFSLDFFH